MKEHKVLAHLLVSLCWCCHYAFASRRGLLDYGLSLGAALPFVCVFFLGPRISFSRFHLLVKDARCPLESPPNARANIITNHGGRGLQHILLLLTSRWRITATPPAVTKKNKGVYKLAGINTKLKLSTNCYVERLSRPKQVCALTAKPSHCLERFLSYTCCMLLLCCSVFSLPSRNQYLIRGYESQQRRTMGVKAMSHMLSTHLYYRRSFPFYTFNILGGLDDEGAVGRCRSVDFICSIRVLCRRFRLVGRRPPFAKYHLT